MRNVALLAVCDTWPPIGLLRQGCGRAAGDCCMAAAGLWQGCCGRAVAGLRATAAVELWQLLLLLRFSCCSAVGGGGGAAAREPEGERRRRC